MDFDSAPRDASVENLLEICEVLREGELPQEELYEAVDQGETLVRDNIRYGVGLGFLEKSEEEVSVTSRGIEASYSQDNSEDLAEQFQDGLRDYQLYNAVLKELVEEVNGEGAITKSDVLQVFRTAVGLQGSEKTLGAAATTFIKSLGAAGLGEYIVGRGGKETRLEVGGEFEALVDPIISDEKTDEPNQQNVQPQQEDPEPQIQSPVTDTLSPITTPDNPFKIEMELSGDEDPAKVEELIVAVRRGLNRNLDTSDSDTENKSEREENLEPDHEGIEGGLEEPTEKDDTGVEDESESDSSDSSLDTFMGPKSQSDEE